MVGALQHRGPDEAGYYRDDRCGLGHARLAIIDLATGQQPMSDADGSAWLVFNGEIFNYVELRAQLEGLGCRFRTKSDTEVLLQAFRHWGTDAFERFNGQFAVAIWDPLRQVLTLARDRLGVRPLYVCTHGSRVWFASEVKAIFAGDPSIPRGLDPDGLAETFTFWSTVAPTSSFTGIFQVEPGHVWTITRDGMDSRAFWTPEYPGVIERMASRSVSIEDATRRVRQALDDAVRLRVLRADVPVGSYLSGGLDSSLVAALGRQYEGDRYVTFSVRFEEAEFDETVHQHRMVDALGSEHQEIVVRRGDIASVFPDVIWHAEHPILRTAPAPLFLLSRLVHEAGIKVVLTGEGADEMFAGYDLFKEGKVRRFWARRPDSELRPRLLERLYPYLRRSPVQQHALARSFFGAGLSGWADAGFAHGPRWRSTTALQQLFHPGFRERIGTTDPVRRLLGSMPASAHDWTPLGQDRYLEIRTLLSGYLLSSQGDRMLMAHSVEGRFPFLDTAVTELAAGLPDAFLLRGLDEKHILKRVAAGLVPDSIIKRPKQPYRAPDAASFVGPDAPSWVSDLLEEGSLGRAGIFQPQAVRRLLRRTADAEGRPVGNSDNMALVGVVSTMLLHEQHVERPPDRGRPRNLRTVVDRLEGTYATMGAVATRQSVEVSVGV